MSARNHVIFFIWRQAGEAEPISSYQWLVGRMMIAISAPQSEYVHLMNLSGDKCAFMHQFIYIRMHINERWTMQDKAAQQGKGARHSGATVMMNADWIYRGCTWVWIREKLDEWRRGGNEGEGEGRKKWMKVWHNEQWVAVRVEGVGGALRQCVYQLKYRHLLLRNSVFWGVGEVCDCVYARARGTHTKVERGRCREPN